LAHPESQSGEFEGFQTIDWLIPRAIQADLTASV